MNRLKEKQHGDPDPDGSGTYFTVAGNHNIWYVSTEMARHIEACLDAEPRPAWIRFVDVTGASVRVRSKDIEYVQQSTPEQRAHERAFHRAMRQEQKADRDWGDEDY